MDLRFAKWEVCEEYALFAMLLLVSGLPQSYFAVGPALVECIKSWQRSTEKTWNADSL